MISESIRSTRVALFLDGPNLLYTAKTLGFDIDFKYLLQEIGRGRSLVRAHYYSLVHETGDSAPIRPLTDWLAYNGFVVSKRTVTDPTDSASQAARRSLNVELAVNAIELAKYVDQIFLFSGNADFKPVVAALQRRGVHVAVVSTLATKPPMIADGLRRQADLFVDLLDLKPFISRSALAGAKRAAAQRRA